MRINFRLLGIATATVFALGAMLTGPEPASAQSQQPQQQFGPRANKTNQAPAPGNQAPPNVEVIATHGAWKVQCEAAVNGADGQQGTERQCGMVQSTQNEKNPKATLTLVLVKSKQEDKDIIMMRVLAPIGVFLPTGVALEIDGNAVGRVPFTRCLPQICMAFAEASPETLVKMKKGNAANFIIYEAPGLGLPMKMSLDGFSAAIAALEKL
ncbi:MAG: invasion associated locus B family protein [Alphaproteobacteria bacterium]|nr:invasion associated locus B family protein [Alphaproteobacteria bacterium]